MPELMNTRLEKKTTYAITDLLGLAGKCDWFVNGCQLIKIIATETPKSIFVSGYTGGKAVSFFANTVMPAIKNNFNLIIASEDHTFPYGIGDVRWHYYKDCQKEINDILQNKFLIKIYVENLDCNHMKCYPIPLGILKYNPIYYKYERLFSEKAPINFDSKIVNVFCCHRNRSGPQWEKRAKVTELAKNNWKEVVTYVDEMDDEEKFMEKLMASKFCLCVQGGGYDPSPKCWQAILCGSIPIIEHSPLDRVYERFPVAFVDSWDAATISQMKLSQWMAMLGSFYTDASKREKVLQMLSLDYWWNIIEDNVSDYECIAAISPYAAKAKQNCIKVTYGSRTQRQDVTRQAIMAFFSEKHIKIGRDVWFNNIFGDVHPGVEKTLEIEFKDDRPSLSLTEKRTMDVVFAYK